jgi:hypothetical protein
MARMTLVMMRRVKLAVVAVKQWRLKRLQLIKELLLVVVRVVVMAPVTVTVAAAAAAGGSWQ